MEIYDYIFDNVFILLFGYIVYHEGNKEIFTIKWQKEYVPKFMKCNQKRM